MNLNDYQQQASKTAIYPLAHGLSYVILGLNGEAGELANVYKKLIRDNNGNLDLTTRAKLADELGDCLWYVAMIATELGLSLDAVAEKNLNKLAARKEANRLHGSGDER